MEVRYRTQDCVDSSQRATGGTTASCRSRKNVTDTGRLNQWKLLRQEKLQMLYPQACAPAPSESSGVRQEAEYTDPCRPAVVHVSTTTSSADAGDDVDEDVAGERVVPNQCTSDKANSKQNVPKAKPKPKTPGRARPKGAEPQQTKLSFK